MEQPNYPSQPPVPPPASPQQEMFALLRQQNELLQGIQNTLALQAQRENEPPAAATTHVIDFDMSIGAMIRFMFKWIIASIPVAIVFGLIWLLFSGVLIGIFAALQAR